VQRIVVGRGVGDHVDEQLLDRGRLLDTTCHLSHGRRTACCHRCPKRGRIARNTIGHLRHPPADRPPILFGVGGHQVEHIAHRLQRRCDHVQLADIEPRVVQIELDAEPFAHRGERDDVDIVLGRNVVQLLQAVASRVGARCTAVGGVVGDVFVMAYDAHFCCRAGIERSEGLETAFGYSIDCGDGPTQGRALRRCRTCSDRRSGIRS
jgi:hypothetical protein